MGFRCKLFGCKWRCCMGFQSVCKRCGDTYEYNVKVCGVCGGNLKFEKGFIGCPKCKSKNKLTLKQFKEKQEKDYLSKGIVWNFVQRKTQPTEVRNR